MVACAKFLGRNKSSCTRGIDNCICLKEETMELEELKALNARFKDLLRQIAYPRRGTEEEYMDIDDAAVLIQANFSLDELDN